MNNPLSITPDLNAIKHIQKDKTFDLPYHRVQDPMRIVLYLYSTTF